MKPPALVAELVMPNILLTTASLGLVSVSLNHGTRHVLLGDVDTSVEYSKDGPHKVLHRARLSLYSWKREAIHIRNMIYIRMPTYNTSSSQAWLCVIRCPTTPSVAKKYINYNYGQKLGHTR